MMRGVFAAAAALSLAACASLVGGPSATAQLTPTRGNAVSGQVTFRQENGRVLVSGEVRGLQPNSEHGFHVHQKGDCSSGDGESAGGHFNPSGASHGRHGSGAHHAGDLPSLKADASGVARFKFESSTISVSSGATDVIGKGLIVHRNPDDFQTQPTGNAGARVACAVIAKD